MLKPMRAQTIDAPPEPRSPLRQALAAAIEKHAEAERDYRAAAKLADDAHGSFLDALGARREAAAALADARERGGCLEILAAIDSEAAATVEVERLRAARERTAAETERPTGARRRTQAAVDGAVRDFFASELPQLLSEFLHVREVASLKLSELIAIEAIASVGALSDQPLLAVRSAIAQSREPLFASAQRNVAGGAWQMARLALELDADAPTPRDTP